MTSISEHDRAQRIQAALRAAGHVDAVVTGIDTLAGGHSGISHVVELDGVPGHTRAVARSAPEDRKAKGRHDVLRQARIMRILRDEGSVPVPTVLATSEEVAPLFVVEFVDGDASDPILDQPLPGETPERISATWDQAIDVLARLHLLSPAALGIDETPRPPADELAVWERTMEAARLELPGVDDLAATLRKLLPEPGSACLVHGDFRLGNIMVRDTRPVAVVDWEIWGVTHPLVDLAWLVQFTDADTYPGIGREVAGTPSRDAVVSRYLDRSGTPDEDLHWYLALGSFKLAAIQAHNRRRHLDGVYHDPFQESLLPSIEHLLDVTRTELAQARGA